uniref:Uncharacterized protein n=1 Tax=Anguilla anguilla TaxID=7936 RepID=A0A0E9SDC0_ANGAN
MQFFLKKIKYNLVLYKIIENWPVMDTRAHCDVRH